MKSAGRRRYLVGDIVTLRRRPYGALVVLQTALWWVKVRSADGRRTMTLNRRQIRHATPNAAAVARMMQRKA